jgi:hypothetical protein
MRSISSKSYPLSGIIKKILEGRISPLNFLLILGFLSTLVLLYVSLHVHFLSVSRDIRDCREKLLMLRDQKARLTTRYNEMISPGQIIPAAKQLGLKPGDPGEIIRFALYRGGDEKHRVSSWSYASLSSADSLLYGISSGAK